jgi:hypothetical protein
MHINIENVESLIFYDDRFWRAVPQLAHIRDQWKISKMSPDLRFLGKKSLLDFLAQAGQHKDPISKYFNSTVTIDSLEYNSVKNLEFKASEDHFDPCSEEQYSDICMHRFGDQVKITLWR